jgi:RES domain-containing protein
MEIDDEDRPTTYQALKIEGPDDVSREVLRLGEGSLLENWPSDITSTQAVGDAWIAEKRSLLLEVPSVLIPETWNVLFNPLHPEAGAFRIVAVYQHAFDPRLF